MNDDRRHSQDDGRLSTQDIAAAVPPDDVRRGEPADARPHEDDRAPRDDDRPAALFVAGDAAGYRTRWSATQTGFVDEPRKAVAEADALVAEVMKRLAEIFADERRRLEAQWEGSDQVSTEELRQAMRRYRSFFERLLTV